jgi:hypothetical protein
VSEEDPGGINITYDLGLPEISGKQRKLDDLDHKHSTATIWQAK